MFHTTIWLERDSEASARAHEEPIEQLRDRARTMGANLETLKTQVADLRDAQGLREGHRALIARLTEIEECASVHTLREFITQILRLESLVCGEHGGIVGEAIRACNRRLDSHKATLDDSMLESGFRICIMICPNKKMMKRHNSPLPGLKVVTLMLRINQVWRIAHLEGVELEDRRHSADSKDQSMIQQTMQRLFVACNQCVARVAQTDDRLEQFRSTIHRDALELTLNVQRTSQDLQYQGQSVERIKRTLFDEVQVKVNHLEEKLCMFGDHLDGITTTIDKNNHSQCASITAVICEQEDIRRLVEELTKLQDQPQGVHVRNGKGEGRACASNDKNV